MPTPAAYPIPSLNVTFTHLKKPVKHKVNGRGVVWIAKDDLSIATHSHFVSFAAIVTWAGGEREVRLMYQRR